MSETDNMNKWVCEKCNSAFFTSGKPKFCPVCGSRILVNESHAKAKRTVERICRELDAEIPEIEMAWKKYAILQAAYEDKVQTLRQYKHRGIILEDEIPKPYKKQVQEVLKEIRAKRKKESSDEN